MILRTYQQLAISRLYAHLREKDSAPCIVIPTGGGKTPVMATICRDAVNCWKSRVLILAHRRELLEQGVDKLRRICPDIGHGVYSAGLRRRDTDEPVIMAGIQSVYKRAAELGRFDLVMVDEAHLIPTEGEGMYRTFLQDQLAINPRVRLIGLTATPYRTGTGWICSPENLLQEICYEVSVRELIADGFLCKLRTKVGKTAVDLSEVHVRGGEYVDQDLEAAFIPIVEGAVKEVLELTADRKKVLIFCCTVAHACAVVKELAKHQPSVDLVVGDTPSELRRSLLDRFKDGDLKYLVNVGVLTEGFDAPNIDAIAILRATKSPGLYYQMVGRGLRTNPGKADCLVLDFGENILRHGPIDKVRPNKEAPGGGPAPTKVCPQCQAVIHSAVTECPDCHYQFPREEQRETHKKEASDRAILSDQEPVNEWKNVQRVTYVAHVKKGFPDAPKTLRVDYRCGFNDWVSEWVCVEHDGYAGEKAKAWWASHVLDAGTALPPNAEAAAQWAMGGCLKNPSRIHVRKPSDPKGFPRVIGYEYSPVREPGQDEEENFFDHARGLPDRYCSGCGHTVAKLSWQPLPIGEGKHLRCECAKCGMWIAWARQEMGLRIIADSEGTCFLSAIGYGATTPPKEDGWVNGVLQEELPF